MKSSLKFNLTSIMLMSASLLAQGGTPLSYPTAPTDSSVVDKYFDILVADPYRPLEDENSPATKSWIEAENALTRSYLDDIPFRSAIKDRLTALNDYGRRGAPARENDGLYYFFENDGLRNQSVLYRKATLDGEPELFLDPNTLSDDGTVALTGISMSNDGRYTAYTISRSGSDWTEIFVMDTKTRKLLPDHIEWAKFTGVEWAGDGFYYSAYDRPEAGKEVSEKNENHRIYYHRMGTSQADDILAYEDAAHPLHFHSAWVPENEEWLVVTGGGEGNGESLMIKSLLTPDAEWITLDPTQDYEQTVIDIHDGKIYIFTNYGAPRNRIMVADINKPQREHWEVFIPEQEGVLTGVTRNDSYLILSYEKDASTHLYLHDIATGKQIREISLPAIGSAAVTTNRHYPDIFYTFTSFTYPSSQFSYDPATDRSTPIFVPELKDVNLDDYVTEQVFYPSADGTRIPMFITYRKDLRKDGSNPVYLYGYGGFNVSLPPSFSAMRMLWLENGGIYAQANLRGGSEYGEEWHQQGTKMNKQNVFDDFIAAAEYMIGEGWTSPENLVIEGGSNGGLLVGAVVNQRPDLFKVAIPRVGVMDMMRYHLFTIGWNWASDYGTSADSPEMAKYLRGYSPAHNVKTDGTRYPAIMVTTADHDDRVVPAHSFKYAAALQAADTGDAPKLIRIDSKAGHGGGKPVSKQIEEYADIYSFILYNLGRKPIK